MSVKPIPDGYHAITPYLIVPGVVSLIEFLRQAFDAEVVNRTDRPDGTVMHAEIRIGDSRIMLGEARPEWWRLSAVGCHFESIWSISVTPGCDKAES